MLLSSIGRASFERIATTISCAKNRVSYNLFNAHRIESINLKNASLRIGSVDFSRRSYAAAARSASGAKRKSVVSPKKSSRLIAKKKGTKVSKKPSTLKKKKIVKKVAKKVIKPKKVLTEKEKINKKQTELKNVALKPPIKLPVTARTAYMADKLKGTSRPDLTIKFSEVSTTWKNLDATEIESYEKLAETNRAINAQNMKEWLSKYSPDQIRIANNARRQISKLHPRSRQWKQIPDERLPKRPVTPYIFFIRESYGTGQYAGVNLAEATKKITSEYKALSPNDRKKYEDMYRISQKKYAEEFKQAFSRESKCSTLAVE